MLLYSQRLREEFDRQIALPTLDDSTLCPCGCCHLFERAFGDEDFGKSEERSGDDDEDEEENENENEEENATFLRQDGRSNAERATFVQKNLAMSIARMQSQPMVSTISLTDLETSWTRCEYVTAQRYIVATVVMPEIFHSTDISTKGRS